MLCISGGSIAAGPAGAEEEGGRAERRVVPELVTGDAEPEKPAGHCFQPVSDLGNTGSGRLTYLQLPATPPQMLLVVNVCLLFRDQLSYLKSVC